YARCPVCRSRYGMYLALGTLAPGARVYIPTPTAYESNRVAADQIVTRLYALGRASSVAWVKSPLSAGPGFDPSPYLYVTGPGRAHDTTIDDTGGITAPWAVAVDPATVAPSQGDPYHALDSTITAEGPHSHSPVREFALIRWASPAFGLPRQD